MTNLASNLVATAERIPDKVGIRLDQVAVTWSQLHQAAARVAGQLQAAGLEPGDRVAVILPNVPAFPVVFWGILLAGGVVVPMNPLLKAGEIDYFFTDSGAKVAFVWPDFVAGGHQGRGETGTRIVECGPMGPVEGEPRGRRPDRRAARARRTTTPRSSSTPRGTTGRPKGAELTHSNIHLNATRSAER